MSLGPEIGVQCHSAGGGDCGSSRSSSSNK